MINRLLTLIAVIPVLAGCSSSQVKWDGDRLLSTDGELVGSISAEYSDGISAKVRKNTDYVEWIFTAEKDIDDARIAVDFIHEEKADWWMIPSVSYNGNPWGGMEETKGAMQDGIWRSYSYLRTPIPGAQYSEGDKFAVATWSEVPSVMGDTFSCSIMPDGKRTVHRLMWPEEEMPVTHYGRDLFSKGWKRSSSMSRGERHVMRMYIDVSETEPDHTSIGHFLTRCWKSAKAPEFEIPSADSVWNLAVRYCKESLWAEEGIFKGFSIGLTQSQDGNWIQRPGWKYEAGWCGQNISIACSLLEDYIRTGAASSLDKGLAALDCWADNCRLPNGLFVTHMDELLSGQSGTQDACNLGTAAVNFIRAYHLSDKCGIERPNYLQLSLDICDFVVSDQREDGCFGRGWTNDGKCVYREGTVGAFMIPALVEAYNETHRDKYLESAVRAHDYYISQLLHDGFSTAGALDCWCIDKESSISLLRSSIGLYKVTKQQKYIDHAVQASFYLSTWLWHHDGLYTDDDPFVKYGYHPYGATCVSIQHPCLDFYAALWIPEWIELSEITGDPQWKEKATAIWRNCCQLISDGNLSVNGKVRPAGGQNEVYFMCSWDYLHPSLVYPPVISKQDRINDWLVAWPSAFRLETLCKTDKIK